MINEKQHIERIRVKAFDISKTISDVEQRLNLIANELNDTGWLIQLVSYEIYKEFGLYEIYISDEKLNGEFLSDMISDAFYQADSIRDAYDRLTGILFELEYAEIG